MLTIYYNNLGVEAHDLFAVPSMHNALLEYLALKKHFEICFSLITSIFCPGFFTCSFMQVSLQAPRVCVSSTKLAAPVKTTCLNFHRRKMVNLSKNQFPV